MDSTDLKPQPQPKCPKCNFILILSAHKKWDLISIRFCYFQIDGSSSRPQSMEGPMDSGISLNGDTISSPDSDNSSQHHIQNQNVRIVSLSFLIKSSAVKQRTNTLQSHHPNKILNIWNCFFSVFLKKITGHRNEKRFSIKTLPCLNGIA